MAPGEHNWPDNGLEPGKAWTPARPPWRFPSLWPPLLHTGPRECHTHGHGQPRWMARGGPHCGLTSPVLEATTMCRDPPQGRLWGAWGPGFRCRTRDPPGLQTHNLGNSSRSLVCVAGQFVCVLPCGMGPRTMSTNSVSGSPPWSWRCRLCASCPEGTNCCDAQSPVQEASPPLSRAPWALQPDSEGGCRHDFPSTQSPAHFPHLGDARCVWLCLFWKLWCWPIQLIIKGLKHWLGTASVDLPSD